jgi:hypothetical protein
MIHFKLLKNRIDFLLRIEETPQGIKQLHKGLCQVNLPFTDNFQHKTKIYYLVQIITDAGLST